ncbi:zinc metalloproteinase nas-13-like [Diadema antillarum]|uniref:zinc metalloproteinase nas-13-like n=1 Tax=Diadema antillarum TaxID=105358 RepID=UPI003A83E2FF
MEESTIPPSTPSYTEENYNITGDLNENGVPQLVIDQRTPSKDDLQKFGTYMQDDTMSEILRINTRMTTRMKDHLLQYDIWVPYNVTEYGDLEFGSTLRRNAVRQRGYQWPNGIVYYWIDDLFDPGSRTRIETAIARYHSYTCIQFRQRFNEPDYLHIVPTEGCYSAVGRQGGRQVVSLGGTCTWNIGTIVHEFMHAIGFQHEQSRSDRDDYVWIYWENVQYGMEFNFQKFDAFATDNLGTSYDYLSVMHYPLTAFSSNGQPTMALLTAGYNPNEIGDRNDFSGNDVYKVNAYYNCLAPTPTCEDLSSGCPSWALGGYCNHPDYQSYMSSNCPLSCGACARAPAPKPTEPSTGCRDAHERCPEWAGKNECVNRSRAWMEANCAVSCGKCVSSPSQPCKDERQECGERARAGECMSEPDFMLAFCRRSCGQCDMNQCRDNEDMCKIWARFDECDKNPAYMHVECQESCNLCGKNFNITPECVDANGNCALWKAEGMCEENAKYMTKMCPASCGICDGDAAPMPGDGGDDEGEGDGDGDRPVTPGVCGGTSSAWSMTSSMGLMLFCWLLGRQF